MGEFPPPPSPEPSFGALRDFIDVSVNHRVQGLCVTFREQTLTVIGFSSVPKKMTRKVREAVEHWFALNERAQETVNVDIRRPDGR